MQTTPKGPGERAFTVLPTTRVGRYAVGLLGVDGLLLLLFFGAAISGQRGGDTFFSNLWLTIPILLAGAAAVAGGLLALFAVLRRGEDGLLAYATILWGALVAAFAAGEFLFPH